MFLSVPIVSKEIAQHLNGECKWSVLLSRHSVLRCLLATRKSPLYDTGVILMQHLCEDSGPRMIEKQLTINDIARLSGVSKKTVSRVLNRESGVKEDTRERVLQVMQAHGYAPNRRARAFAAGRSFLLGVAFDNPNSNYVLSILNGVFKSAQANGYEVVVHPFGLDTKASLVEELTGFMARSGCDGIILTPPLSEQPSVMTWIEQSQISVCRISGDDVQLRGGHVRFDDRTAAMDITNYLVSEGHQKIAFLGGPQSASPSRRRYAGFRDAMTLHGLTVRPEWVRWGAFTFVSGVDHAEALFDADERPTAIMCCNDEMAVGVIQAARTRSIRVPEDISVTGFDDAPIASEVWPPLTTVEQPLESMGQVAASILIGHIENTATTDELVSSYRHQLKWRSSVVNNILGIDKNS